MILPKVAPRTGRSARAFTLVELMVASAIGSVIAGGILLLLCQTATEQKHGYADTTVEQQAYVLEANLTTTLRTMSATMGMTPNYSTLVSDSHGNPLGYQSIYMFFPSNGNYTQTSIIYNSNTGTVTYTSNTAVSTSAVIWASNATAVSIPQLYFNTSQNLDGSQNSSLVTVFFEMNDNGFSRQTNGNNPTSIYRTFSVQMRNDY